MSSGGFSVEQLQEESGSSSSIQCLPGKYFVVRLCPVRPRRAHGCKAESLLVSMEGTAEYKSSALFYEYLYLQCCSGVFFKRKIGFALNLSLKLQCWFLSYKWSCFPIFFLFYKVTVNVRQCKPQVYFVWGLACMLKGKTFV